MLDALAYMKAARSYQIPAALEVSQSGRGAHVWIFFVQATSASVARGIATAMGRCTLVAWRYVSLPPSR